jgi:hypothetical protein
MIKLKCAGCKKAEGITVVCSMFGATSFALCDKCLREGREDYRNMVKYISCAGHWPQDINDIYQAEVRRQLKLHDVPEEVFKFEVERAIAEEQAFITEMCAGKTELTEVLKGEF